MRRETRISYSFGPATQPPRPDGIRERRNGLRADARACEGAARGVGVPASDRAGVWGGAPRWLVLCGAKRGFRTRLGQLLSCHGPTAHGSGVTGCARTRAPARERRGALGAPQATEPGCGAEPHVGWSATARRRNGLRADARACEGAARGVGVPASDRAG